MDDEEDKQVCIKLMTDIEKDKYEGHTEGPWHIIESDSGTGYGDGSCYLGLSGEAFITELSFRSNEHENHPDVQLIADAPLLLEGLKRLLEEVKRLREHLVNAELCEECGLDYAGYADYEDACKCNPLD